MRWRSFHHWSTGCTLIIKCICWKSISLSWFHYNGFAHYLKEYVRVEFSWHQILLIDSLRRRTAGGANAPPSPPAQQHTFWEKYFKIMQLLTKPPLYTPNFNLTLKCSLFSSLSLSLFLHVWCICTYTHKCMHAFVYVPECVRMFVCCMYECMYVTVYIHAYK